METTTVQERLANLFSGYENVYGQYSTANAQVLDSGKVDGRAWTNRGFPDWKKHLEGKVGLGLIPLRINDSVRFAAIDVDVYKNIDHKKIVDKIRKLGLPLIVCRSKSGGAHLYVFFEEDVPAKPVITILSDWATALGFGGSEVFPKQFSRTSPEDIGNWINIPYFGGDLSNRYGYDPKTGNQLNLREFVDAAEDIRTTKSKFLSFKVGLELNVSKEDDLLFGAPPCCIQAREQGGFPEGTRNDAMFNVGVFARKKWPENDEWVEKIYELNKILCNPAVNEFEMKQLVKSLMKHETYEMRCNGPFCNKKRCREKTFGRGPMVSDLNLDIGNVTKIEGEESTWFIEINERRVRMGTKHLMSQSRFNERTVDAINLLTPMLQHNRWLDFIQKDILDKADVIQLPVSATWGGQFWFRFTQFANALGLKATVPEEVMIGKVFQLPNTSDIVFLPVSLFEFLGESRFKYETPEQIWAELIDHKVRQEKMSISNTEVEVWRITKPQEIRPEVTVSLTKEAF